MNVKSSRIFVWSSILHTAPVLAAAHCALLYLEVGGVAADLTDSLGHLGGDGDLALEGVLGQVRLQPDDVVAGHHGGGEAGELLGHGGQNTLRPACSISGMRNSVTQTQSLSTLVILTLSRS